MERGSRKRSSSAGNIMKFLVMIKIFNMATIFKIPIVVCRSHGANCRGGGENVFPVLM